MRAIPPAGTGSGVAAEAGMARLSDLGRRQALCEILAKPDRFDSLRRSRLVVEGDPNRHAQVARLALTYIQNKLLEMHGQPFPSSGLSVVRHEGETSRDEGRFDLFRQ